MTLLDSAMDMTFTLKDVIYIVGLIAGGLAQFFWVKYTIKEIQEDLKIHKETFIAYKAARKATIKEMEDRIDKTMEMKMFEPMRMVTSMEERMEKHEEKMERHMGKLGDEMSLLRKDIMEIFKNGKK